MHGCWTMPPKREPSIPTGFFNENGRKGLPQWTESCCGAQGNLVEQSFLEPISPAAGKKGASRSGLDRDWAEVEWVQNDSVPQAQAMLLQATNGNCLCIAKSGKEELLGNLWEEQSSPRFFIAGEDNEQPMSGRIISRNGLISSEVKRRIGEVNGELDVINDWQTKAIGIPIPRMIVQKTPSGAGPRTPTLASKEGQMQVPRTVSMDDTKELADLAAQSPVLQLPMQQVSRANQATMPVRSPTSRREATGLLNVPVIKQSMIGNAHAAALSEQLSALGVEVWSHDPPAPEVSEVVDFGQGGGCGFTVVVRNLTGNAGKRRGIACCQMCHHFTWDGKHCVTSGLRSEHANRCAGRLCTVGSVADATVCRGVVGQRSCAKAADPDLLEMACGPPQGPSACCMATCPFIAEGLICPYMSHLVNLNHEDFLTRVGQEERIVKAPVLQDDSEAARERRRPVLFRL